ARGTSTACTARRTPASRCRPRGLRRRTPSSAPRVPVAAPPRRGWRAWRSEPRSPPGSSPRSWPRVDRAYRRIAVLVRRATGHVVAAVGVRARLARRLVAVLGAYQALVGGRGWHLRVPPGGELLA